MKNKYDIIYERSEKRPELSAYTEDVYRQDAIDAIKHNKHFMDKKQVFSFKEFKRRPVLQCGCTSNIFKVKGKENKIPHTMIPIKHCGVCGMDKWIEWNVKPEELIIKRRVINKKEETK